MIILSLFAKAVVFHLLLIPAITLLAGLVLASLAKLKKAPASLRAAISGATLIVILVLPWASMMTPKIPIDIFPATPDAHAESLNRHLSDPGVVLPLPAVSDASASPPQSISSTVSARSLPATAPSRSYFNGYMVSAMVFSGLVLIWLLGILWQLSVLMLGFFGIMRLRWSSHVATEKSLVEALHTARSRLDYKGTVMLLISDKISLPITWGWIRPKIALPPDALNWPMERLDSAFLHELAHIKRRDFAIQTLSRFTCAFHWYNPLVRRLFQIWKSEAEQACDDLVLRSGYSGERYSDILLEIWRHATLPRPQSSLGLAMVRTSTLEQRVVAILDEEKEREEVSPRRQMQLLAIFGGITVLIAIIGLTRPTDHHLTPELRNAAEAIRQQAQFLQTTPLFLQMNLERRLDNWSPSTRQFEQKPHATAAEIRLELNGETARYRAQYHPYFGGATPDGNGDRTDISDGNQTWTDYPDGPKNSKWSGNLDISELAGFAYRANEDVAVVVEGLLEDGIAPFNTSTYGINETTLSGVTVIRLQKIANTGAFTQRRVWWFDPQRDYSVVQYEIATFENGSSLPSGLELVTINECQKIADRIWYPTRFTTQGFHYQNGQPADNTFHSTTTLTSLSVVPATDERAFLPSGANAISHPAEGPPGMVASAAPSNDSSPQNALNALHIIGTVTDKNGQSVPRAEVRVQRMESRRGLTTYSPGSPDPSLDFAKIGTCDEKGRFAIKNVSRDVLFTLVAAAPGYGPEFAKKVDPKSGAVKITLVKLDPSQEGGMARGHVVDFQGRPIAQAQVRPDMFTVWGTNTNDAGREVQNTVTDQDGNFSIPPAPPYQGVDVLVMAPGFARKYFTLIPYNNQPQELVVEKGVAVTGRLVMEGKPLPQIQVGIAQKNNAYLGEVTATTDREGRFELENVAANDEYEIYGKRDSLGMLGVPEQKFVKTGEIGTPVSVGDILAIPGRKISGRIVLSDGKPPALGRPVQLHASRGGTSDYQYINLGPDLKFELMVRDKEDFSLSAWISGYRLATPNEQQAVKVTPDLKPIEMVFVPDQSPVTKADASTIRTATITVAPTPTAQELFDGMMQKYAKCTTFSCTGHYEQNMDGPLGTANHSNFSIRYERPSRIRVEWTKSKFMGLGSETGTIYTEGGKIFSKLSFLPAIEPDKSMDDAIGGAAGVSGTTSYLLPSLLIGKTGYFDHWNLERKPDDSVDGNECYVIELETKGFGIYTLALRKSDDALLRAVNVFKSDVADAQRARAHKENPAWFNDPGGPMKTRVSDTATTEFQSIVFDQPLGDEDFLLTASSKSAASAPPATDASENLPANSAKIIITPVAPPGVEWEKIAIQSEGSSKTWTLLPDGRSLQTRLSFNNYRLRAVGRTRGGQLYFSEPQYLQVTSSDPINLKLDTFSPAFQVKGSLDASVPRPIKNGLVIACATSGSKAPAWSGWMLWNVSAEIHPDGTFEISNLPPPTKPIGAPQAGPLELIATCDDYVSRDPAVPRAEYSVGPQVFTPPISQPINLAMEPTGSARVRVLDPQGKPLAGVAVRFCPNQSFHWISTVLGSPMNDEKTLFDGWNGDSLAWQKLMVKYQSTTDKDGVAIVNGLPSGLEPYVVVNASYDTPFRRRLDQSSSKYAQNGIVTVAAGAQATAEMRLIPKMEPIAIPNSVSPNGKYGVSVEANQPGYDPQAVVIRNANTREPIVATRLPYNPEQQVDLVSASDKVKVEWNPSSSFFIFSVWRTDHLDMLAVAMDDKGQGYATTDLSLPYGTDSKVLSYEFVGERTIKLTLEMGAGKTFFGYDTVDENGIVHGGSTPDASAPKAQNFQSHSATSSSAKDTSPDIGDAASLWLEGNKLTADQIAVLETKVAHEPSDLRDRIIILGFYFIKRALHAEARDAAQPHILWIIHHAPASAVAGEPVAGVDYRLDLPHYEEARAAWTEELAQHPNDPKVMGNAASFFLLNDSERAEKLLQEVQKIEPNNPTWAMRLGQLYALRSQGADTDMQPGSKAAALHSYEQGISNLKGADRFYALEAVATAALTAGDMEKARQYAGELLQTAPRYPKDWNYGNAIYTGNSVLGQAALAKGDIPSAKNYLLAAGDSPGSPQLNSFGPNLTLARQLLSKGEKDAVIIFLGKIARFWSGHEQQIQGMQKAIRDGQTTF